MSYIRAKRAFEAAWTIADGKQPPNFEAAKIAEGLGELTKAIEEELRVLKSEVSRIDRNTR